MTFSRLWIQAVAALSASVLLGSYPVIADSIELTTEAEARAAIKAINDEIATLEQLITSQSKERDEIQSQLRDTDVAIGRASEALRKTQASLDQRQRDINELEADGLRIERSDSTETGAPIASKDLTSSSCPRSAAAVSRSERSLSRASSSGDGAAAAAGSELTSLNACCF